MMFVEVVNCAWLCELPQRFECFAIVLWKIGDITNCAKVRKPVTILSLPFLHCTIICNTSGTLKICPNLRSIFPSLYIEMGTSDCGALFHHCHDVLAW